jgi:hypothetical protein
MLSLIGDSSFYKKIFDVKEPCPETIIEIAPIQTCFQLPLSYLDKDQLFSLNPIVSSDLELAASSSAEPCMYEYLFLPKHAFAKHLIPKWQESYTTNVEFLKDTQTILAQLSDCRKSDFVVDCDRITQIWDDIKQDEYFLEQYGYMDWDMLKHLNESDAFLQAITFVNIASPVFSLMMPILFLIFPFIILKLQGIPIDIEMYVQVLKDIAKNHFIGKAILSLEKLSWENMAYLAFTLGLYGLQIYQNVTTCLRFYKNVKKINNTLIDMRDYCAYSIESMTQFLSLSSSCSTYEPFRKDVEQHRDGLKRLLAELLIVTPFCNSVLKFNESGKILRCYYSLYANQEYRAAISYSVGFEGYVNNMFGVVENIKRGLISKATFVLECDGACELKQQQYPPLTSESARSKNTCSFKKNAIISAPNKAGKTTMLKTTTINIVFSQQVGCGFYEAASIIPYTHIHSYLNIPDTSGRDSLFQAESRRCKEILDIIQESDSKSRHFCIFDELYSGTNPEEAAKSGKAFLEYLANYSNVNFMLTTHYVSICKKFKDSEKIQNYKMEVIVLKDGTFEYTYKMKKGISNIKGGIRVLKDMNYPKELISMMENASG